MNPYALMAAVAFWVLSLGAVGIWQYDDGAQHERLVWKTQQSNLLRTALADVSRLQTQARADELAHAEALAKVSADYQERLNDEKTNNGRIVAGIRAGAIRLRQPEPNRHGTGSGISAPDAATGRCDAGAGSELPPETAEFLFSLAGEADDISEQLAACQKVIRLDRALGQSE